MIIGVSWWKVLFGFFVMHYTAGLILSVVFQLAHVIEDTANPLPNEDGEMDIKLKKLSGVLHKLSPSRVY
jgi:linoleoyl-CoA desaturase